MANQLANFLQGLNPFRPSQRTAGAVGFSAAAGSVLETVYPVQVRRLRQDVQKWRDALERAENVYYPDRTQLLNIYADTVLDLHLSSVLATRKINVTSQPFKLVDGNGEEDPKATKLLKRPWFRRFCEYYLEHLDYGHSLVEFGPPTDGEFHRVELVNRQYVFPEAGLVRTMPGMITGIDYRNDPQYTPWLLEIGGPHDLGLLLKAAPLVIWKQLVLGAWADFTEMFGMPYRALTGDFDPALINQFNDMMATMGQAAYGVFPGNTKIDFVAPPAADGKVYDAYIERVNSELSKLVLGQTMTTDNGSSRSQSEVHERVADAYTRDDMTGLAEYVNDRLLPFLLLHGYPVAGIRFEWDESESLSKPEQWKIVNEIIQRGYKVPDAYITETFGIPTITDTAPQREIYAYHIDSGGVSTDDVRKYLGLPVINETDSEKQRELLANLKVVKAATDAGMSLADAVKMVGLDVALTATLPPTPDPAAPGKPQGLPAYPVRQARPNPAPTPAE